jgi:hypothetical protein
LASKKTVSKRATAEQYVWVVSRGANAIAFGSEAGAREALDVVAGAVAAKATLSKVRYLYDSATTADIQDTLKLPMQETL